MRAGLINADDAHCIHVVARPGFSNVDVDTPPQWLVRAAQHRGCQAHGHDWAQRQRERFEQCCEARARARPGAMDLMGLAAARARLAGHFDKQPGLELEEIQMPPPAAQALRNRRLQGEKSFRSPFKRDALKRTTCRSR